MKKIISMLFFVLLYITILINNTFAANVLHTFSDEEWTDINNEWDIISTGLDVELNDGPGYEMLKEKYETYDFNYILNEVDKNYGQSEGEALVVIAPKDAKVGVCNGAEIDYSLRDKQVLMKEDADNKKAEKKEEKDDDGEEKEKGSMKVRIAISVDKNHPNNPTQGSTYNKTYIFYTDCDKLGDVLRENELTSDVGFLTVLDDIDGSATINEEYSADFMHGTWEGYSWMIYKNGKTTNVGMEDLKITDGCSYRFKAEYQKMVW